MADVAGATILRDARGRRVGERDRRGQEITRLAWKSDGSLQVAAVRLPDGDWLIVEPRAMRDTRWGVCDVVRLAERDTALTHFAAVNWAAVEGIPPLAEPARLPAGAGTAVLNLVAALAADQGRARLPYLGPYPTEQLFVALLEAFRWETDEAPDDPLAAFMRGALTWTPAPFSRTITPEGACVQARERIEKVVWRGRTYVRADWQGVERHAAHRVRDVAGAVCCSLWALGTALEDHLVLTAAGDVIAAPEPATTGSVATVDPELAAGLIAVVVASSAPALADAIRAVAAELTFSWVPLAGELATLTGEHARLSSAMLVALRARRAATSSRVEEVRLGFVGLAELAAALGDTLRVRAQVRLAAAEPAAQIHALGAAVSPEDTATSAQRISRAVEALLETAAQLMA